MAQNRPLEFLVEGLTQAFDNEYDCDVIFIVDEKTIGAHRVILRIHSPVLYEMAENWTPEKDPIVIEDISYDAFKSFLRYMYNGQLDISNTNVFIFLAASTIYEIQNMKKLCENHLSQIVAIDNVCTCLEEAMNFKSSVLQQKCMKMISQNTAAVLETESFLEVPQSALSMFLDSGRNNVIEIDIFQSVEVWMKRKCQDQRLPVNGTNMRKVIGEALYKMRFPTMTVQDFANCVTTIKGLLTESEIAQVFQKIAVFDNKDIECPFPDEYRCTFNTYACQSVQDMEELLKGKTIYNEVSDQFCDASSMLKDMKRREAGEAGSIGTSLVYLRLTLQYYADLANSTCIATDADDGNQQIRQELQDEFENLEKIANTHFFHKTMTKFTELQMKLNELCKWHLES